MNITESSWKCVTTLFKKSICVKTLLQANIWARRAALVRNYFSGRNDFGLSGSWLLSLSCSLYLLQILLFKCDHVFALVDVGLHFYSPFTAIHIKQGVETLQDIDNSIPLGERLRLFGQKLLSSIWAKLTSRTRAEGSRLREAGQFITHNGLPFERF